MKSKCCGAEIERREMLAYCGKCNLSIGTYCACNQNPCPHTKPEPPKEPAQEKPEHKCNDPMCMNCFRNGWLYQEKDKPEQPEWEKEFDKTFSKTGILGDRTFEEYLPNTYEAIKTFVALLLQEKNAEVVKDFEEVLAINRRQPGIFTVTDKIKDKIEKYKS